MRRIVRLLAVAALLGLVAVGCGDSDGSSASTGDNEAVEATTTTSTTTTTTTAPEPKTLTAAEVVDGLRAAGLPIGTVEVYDATTDPNENLGRPGQYTSKAAFADTRIGTEVDGVDGGGDVEAFDDPDALSARAEYLQQFAEEPLIGGWYQYTAGNAILRVPFELTPDQAEQYNTALQALFQ